MNLSSFRYRKPELILSLSVLLIVAYLVLLPMGMIIYGSFQDGPPFLQTNFTIQNFISFFTSNASQQAMRNTLWVAIGNTIFSVVGGTILAWITVRVKIPFIRLIQICIVIPFLFSPFVGAVAWGYLAAPDGFGLINRFLRIIGITAVELNIYSIGGLIWVMGIYGIPLVYFLMSNAFQTLDFRLEEIAEITGASRWLVIRTIVIPLVLPAFLSSVIITFVTACESYAVPAVLGIPARIDVLATRIVIDVQSFPLRYGRASASAVVLTIISLLGMLAYFKALGYQRRFVTITGKIARPAPKESRAWSIFAGIFVSLYIILVVVLPLIVLLVLSFQFFYGQPLFPIRMTLANYVSIFNDTRFVRAFSNSMIMSLVGPFICVLIGFLVSMISVRYSNKFGRIAEIITTGSLAIPGIVLGLALLWVYLRVPIPIYGTLIILILATITRQLPQATRITTSILLQLSPELEEASQVSGSSWFRTFRSILFPLMAPALVSAFLILFIVSIREISSVMLLYGLGTEILPVLMLELWTEGMFVQVAAMAMIQLAIMIFAMSILLRFLRSPLQVMG
jgi:iron(III) transport system permease protein